MTRKAVNTYFICIFLPLVILLLLLISFNHQSHKQKYERSSLVQTQYFTTNVSEKFSAITSSANSIFNARWYNHFMNLSGVYDHEFTMLKQNEVANSISTMRSSMEFVTDIYIIAPTKDTVVTTNGWYTLDRFREFYNKVSVEVNDGTIKVTDIDENIFSLVLDDTNSRKNKAVICLVCDREQFSRYCKKLIDSNMLHVMMSVNNNVVLEYASDEFNDRYFYRTDAAIIKYPNLNSTVLYESYTSMVLPSVIATVCAYIFAAAIASFCIAYLLVRGTVKPLNELAKKYNNAEYKSSKEAIKYINDYVESVTHRNMQLNREKEDLQQQVSHFFSVMENEIMFAMLTNPDFSFDDDYIKNNIPWINEKLPFMLVLIESERFSRNHIKLPVIPEKFYRYSRSFKILDGEYCTILWFDNNENTDMLSNEVHDFLKEALPHNCFFMLSEILHDPHDMSASYITLSRALKKQMQVVLDLPTQLQIKLITKIQSGSMDECEKLIRESYQEYDPDAFFMLLLRISYEYEIDSLKIIATYENKVRTSDRDELWNIVLNFTDYIIHKISTSKRRRSDDTATMIREFIDNNYRDPAMSIKMLSEHFELDGTLVSKIFKAESGMSFTDYLLEQRMKAALNMLSRSDLNVSSISEAVGYTNYLTFKRAFMRFQGMTPKEYREMKMIDEPNP